MTALTTGHGQQDAIIQTSERPAGVEEPETEHITTWGEKVLSSVRTKNTNADANTNSEDAGLPPDGGFKAWLQVALGHLVAFNTWGYVTSFGMFQTYYTQTLGHPPSDISWVGSVQIFVLFFVGIFSGRASDAGYFRLVLVLGFLVEVLGIFMTSLCTRYWQLFVAQGITQSIGCGLMFCPVLALPSTYFSEKRSVAMSFVACGSATGGLVFPAVAMRLLPRIGYAWTMRVLGLIAFVTLIPCILFLRQRLPPRAPGPLVEWSAFKEPAFLTLVLGMFLNFSGLYVGYFYIGSFGRTVLHIPQSTSIDLLLVLNGIGVPMRILPSLLADRYAGPLNVLLFSSFATAVVSFGWVGVSSVGGLYAFAIVYGAFVAGIQALFPATLSSITPDLKLIGTRMGMAFGVMSVAALIGSPIAGALVQVRAKGLGGSKDGDGNGNGGSHQSLYFYAQMFMGSCIAAGSLVLVGTRVSRLGGRVWGRV